MCPSTSKVVSTACGSLCGSYGGGPPCIGRRSGPCIFYGTNTNEKFISLSEVASMAQDVKVCSCVAFEVCMHCLLFVQTHTE